MRHRLLLAALLALTVPVLPAFAADLPPAADAAPTDAPTRLAGKVLQSGAAACRRDLGQGESCTAVPGAGSHDVAAFGRSETARALALQSRLGDALPLRTSSWVGTHNSANSTSERPTLSTSDSNQQLSLADQLALGVRSLELDIHWWPSAAAGGARVPLLCHAQGNHEGCTTERSLRERLGEVVAWMDAHPSEVLFLYLEDHLDDAQGYAAGAAVLKDVLGDRLYRPADRGEAACSNLPPTLSRDDVRRAGKQAFAMSGCGTGSDWGTHVFRYSPKTEARPMSYSPGCGGFDPVTTDPVFLRFYEDSTFVSAAGELGGVSSVDDGLTPATTAAAVRCGVDLLGFDQLLPQDGRLAALVWSFAPGELDDAVVGDCAVQRSSDGRWSSQGCAPVLPAACRTSGGAWLVTAPTTHAASVGRCAALGAEHAVPRRGRDSELLRQAQVAAGADDVRLALQRSADDWV